MKTSLSWPSRGCPVDVACPGLGAPQPGDVREDGMGLLPLSRGYTTLKLRPPHFGGKIPANLLPANESGGYGLAHPRARQGWFPAQLLGSAHFFFLVYLLISPLENGFAFI